MLYCDVETSSVGGGEEVGGHAHFAGVLQECRRLCCCLSRLCEKSFVSGSVWSRCSHSGLVEAEVGQGSVGVHAWG